MDKLIGGEMGKRIKLFLVYSFFCGVISCPLFAGQVLLDDDFANFNSNMWKVDKPESFVATDSVMNIGRVHDILADKHASPSARLTSFDYFRYVTLETRIKLVTKDFTNRYYYFGFFNRKDWGQTNCWIVSSGDTLILQSKKKGGQLFNVASQSGFLPGRWYEIKIFWSREIVEFFVDGKSIGYSNDPRAIPDNFMPAVFDIYASDGGYIGMQVDYVKIFGEEKIFSSRPTTNVHLPKNSDLYPQEICLPDVVPNISLSMDQSEEKVLMENKHYAVFLSLKKGLSISGALNKYNRIDCFTPSGSRVFMAMVNGKRLDSRDFTVVNKEIDSWGKNQKALKLFLELQEPKVEIVLTAIVDNSPNIKFEFVVKNSGSKKLTFTPTFPLLENVLIGSSEESYYFYPYQGGWCGNAPYDLREEYGSYCWMQVMSVFNPETSGGISTWVEDKTGGLKVMTLRKVEKLNYEPIPHNQISLKQLDPGDMINSLNPGIVMAVTQMEKEIAPGKSISLPQVIVAIHSGDWRYALDQYKKWSRTWYRHTKSPEWLNRYFNNISVHDGGGNSGFEQGYYSTKENRYIATEFIRPDREDHLMEWAYWWNYCKDPNIPWARVAMKSWMGDYYYPEDRGGLKAIVEEIKKCQDKGSRIRLYMEVTLCGKDTDAPGVYNRDYCVEPEDGWVVCPYEEGWQDYIAKRFATIIKETGADGVRLDRGAIMYPCFNAGHKHYNGTLESTVPAKEWANFLKKVVIAVRRENPEACVYTEHAASDYLTQFYDGSTAQQFEWRFADYEDKKALNVYDLIFFRFLFPEFKLYNWGQTFEDGAKTSFFNAVCFERSDLKDEAEVYYLARTGKVLRESGDVFATLDPVPLVPTKVDYLYANKFPLKNKVIYTIYNKNSSLVKGELIAVPHMVDSHYVELLYDEEVPFMLDSREALLSFSVAPNEVAAAAQLQEILKVEHKSTQIVIRLKNKIKSPRIEVYFDNDAGKGIAGGRLIPLINQVAVLNAEDCPKDTKIIVKLFSEGYLMDEVITYLTTQK